MFKPSDIEYWKSRAEKYYKDYIAKSEEEHPLTDKANSMFGIPD